MICSLVSAYAFHPTLAPRTPKIAHRSRTAVADLAAAKSALFAALDGAPDRGLAEYEDYQTPAWVSAVADAVDALQPLDPSRGDWMVDPAFSGSWLLAYTSSPTFRRNRGLSGYETFVDGVETPQLVMELLPRSKLSFEEPLDDESAAALATHFRLSDDEPPESVEIDCSWVVGADDSLRLTFSAVRVGSKTLEPVNAAAQGKDVVDFDADKAIRVLEVTRPVYVDNDVLILRALTDAFFVWERAAFELE